MYLESEYIPVNLESVVDSDGTGTMVFKRQEFSDGFNNGTYYAGFATALFNAGLEEESVANILMTMLANTGGGK